MVGFKQSTQKDEHCENLHKHIYKADNDQLLSTSNQITRLGGFKIVCKRYTILKILNKVLQVETPLNLVQKVQKINVDNLQMVQLENFYPIWQVS